MMTTIAAIRAEYPNPVTVKTARHTYDPNTYCVGGAVCWYAFLRIGISRDSTLPVLPPSRFPGYAAILDSLIRLNPSLAEEKVQKDTKMVDKVVMLVAYNDAGNFEAAWAIVSELLAYSPGNKDE